MVKKVFNLNYIGLKNLILKYEIDTYNLENIKYDLSIY